MAKLPPRRLMIFPKTDSCKELSVSLPKKWIIRNHKQAIIQLKIIFKILKQNIYSHDFDLLNTPAPCKEESSLADL